MKSGHAGYVKFTLKSVIKIPNGTRSLKKRAALFETNTIRTDTKKC
jgi:hypothetical protein